MTDCQSRNENCTKCGLNESTKDVCIWGIGPKKCEIAIIGEAPGPIDRKTGKPRDGEATKLFKQELINAGIDPDQCYWTNMVKCRPPEGRSPTNPELKACRPYLDSELDQVNPRYVLLLGATALKYIKKKGITELRGSVFELDGRTYFPIFHPAAILRDPGKEPGFKADIAKFARLVAGETPEQEVLTQYRFITPDTWQEFFDEFEASKAYSFDNETTGLQVHDEDFRVNSIGFTLDTLNTWVLPLNLTDHPDWKIQCKAEGITDRFGRHDWARQTLSTIIDLSEGKIGIGQNAKFDNMGILSRYGRKFCLNFDTMLASHIFDENTPHDLKYLAKVFCGARDYDDLLLKQKLDPIGQKCLTKFFQYQAEDPYWTMRLYQYYSGKLKGTYKLRRLFNKLVMPAARLFERVDYRGLYIKTDEQEQVIIDLKKNIAQNEKDLNAMVKAAGYRRVVNWGSPKQVADVLFNRLGLPVVERTPTGAPSTGESALLELQGQSPICDKLIEWRGNQKNLNTYAEGWKALMIGPMLYLSTKLHGTVTGRYSSRLHQVPRDGTIRNLVDAPPGWTFVCADFSQIELRLVAHVSQDPTMLRIFQEGGDIHVETAKSVMMTDEEPTKEQRKAAKGVNFGYVYGMWWVKFKKYAKEKYGVELTDQQAKSFREAYFAKYFTLLHWHDRIRDIVREQGYVEYLSGRLRRLPGVFSSDKQVRQEAERQAINSPIQGFGSGDLKVMALLALDEEFDGGRDDPDLVIAGEVHDSGLLWVKTNKLEEIVPQIKEIMENPPLLKTFGIKLDVPLVVDVEIGTWGKGIKYVPGEPVKIGS